MNSDKTNTVAVRSPLADKDLFGQWLFMAALQVTCAVMALLPKPLGLVQRTAFFITGFINENYSLLDWANDTAWKTAYWLVIGVFVAGAVLMVAALFIDRWKRRYLLWGMFAVHVIFLAANLSLFYVIKPIMEKQTVVGIPWEVSWSNSGYIYLVVSAFALLELVMTTVALSKRAKAAIKEENIQEKTEGRDNSSGT